ncbi:DUF3775 domain-containing protein [Muricoccus radiodurans]|uniref:DUF3775 domain-containing protein n=1 Tax=Muricoccus radiodurans TaxID=2231721 RepID=UPI003CE6E836
MSDSPGGIPGLPKDDDEVDLGISIQAVANIIDAARASEEGEEDDVNEDVEMESADSTKPDLTEDNLETLIDELNEDEQAALIALVYVGRGDFEPDEWEEALKLAHERNESNESTSGYLTGMELLGDLLAEGLAAFGIVVEEIQR